MKRFFTLIELLVVVAIIGILMTLLMPSMKKAREKAVQAVCMNNSQQMGNMLLDFTMTQYKTAPDDSPIRAKREGKLPYYVQWRQKVGFHAGYEKDYFNVNYTCPEKKRVGLAISWGFNPKYDNTYLSKINSPSKVVGFGEAKEWKLLKLKNFLEPHGGKGVVWCFDGHSESTKKVTLQHRGYPPFMADPKRNR